MREKTDIQSVAYKEDLINILLYPLEIAGLETRGSSNFEKDYQKHLKLQNEHDWYRYRASIDLLVDTQYAIEDGFRFQLGRRGESSYDEHYLRLYGILNAVYLQMSAYDRIAQIVNFPSRTSVMKSFKLLSIYTLRNLAGAHTVDYKHDSEIKSTAFRLSQMDLDYSGKHIVMIGENSQKYSFNLLNELNEYDKQSTRLLIDLIKHIIVTLVYKKEYKLELRSRLESTLNELVENSSLNQNDQFQHPSVETSSP